MSFTSAVRIVNVDFYMSPPLQDLDVMYSEFRGSSVTQVPVIRIFGSTNAGKKICLHLHGVFPYLYIPYDGSEDASLLKYQIAANIDKAINISFGKASSTAQHVYKITLVSGIPFYGYHVREHQFFKIFLYNPSLIRKVGNLLQSEAILGKLYQPHEAHIPYILQFMIDYNLHGMSKIHLAELKFRVDPAKQSSCELEADALSEHILNRLEVSQGSLGINPGIAALWEDEKQRLRDQNEDSLISPCLTLSNTSVAPTKSHQVLRQALLEKLIISENAAEKTDQNISVYPAETPQNKNVKNASFIDFHSPLSSDLDQTVDLLSSTFDEEAEDLFQVLQDLGGENVEKVDEGDSILSQKQADEDEQEDDFLDLSLSMAETTPFKNILNDFGEGDSDDSLDKTLVPQLDGQNDSSSSDDCEKKIIGKKSGRKTKSAAKYRALPIYVSSPAVSSEKKALLQSKNQNDIYDYEHVKRKLNFQNTPDFTICEDSLECQFTPEQKENIRNLESQDESLRLTVAELYDIHTNFKAKEGNSKKLTQQSQKSDESLTFADFSQRSQKSDESLSQGTQLPLSQVSQKSDDSFTFTSSSQNLKPPTRLDVINSLESLNFPKVLHETPFYGNVEDVTRSVEVGHSVLKIQSKTTAHLDDFKSSFDGIDRYRKTQMPENVKWCHENVKHIKLSFCSAGNCVVTPAKRAPTVRAVKAWVKNRSASSVKIEKKEKKATVYIAASPERGDESDLELSLTQISPSESSLVIDTNTKKSNSCQLTGVTLDNTYGFKITPENMQSARAVNEFQYLTILALELHIETRADLKPDPDYDAIKAIFYSIREDCPEAKSISGIIAWDHVTMPGIEIIRVETEEELLNEFIKLVQKWDPDILLGYETEMLSWGYLLDRSRVLGNNLLESISRVKCPNRTHEDDGLKVTGRVILNVWRLFRHEIAVQSYTFESVVYHILRQRVPLYSFKQLTAWWKTHRYRTVSHYLFRVEALLELVERQDLVGRTSELARLFGIQFFEVLSRGSQFRVESMMLRLAKPLNYIPVSPSVQQRAQMKAPEFLPLILEPESKLYTNPVIVLDFQSLYPSMIIAYNYCFSTCIGKVKHLGTSKPFEFGATQLRVSRGRVVKLANDDALNFSPCGVAFVKSRIRDGILPRMLREILETRIMVKNSMKKNKGDKLLQKVLHNRQLGLKLIANVTYGYTAANFSGRMPSVELGDSVVSKGRETLQRAIALVENTKEWRAKVVYGDTDSLFVLVPGKSKEEAFEIGRKIANAVTEDNPDPVKLKLEKVYYPCILQTKKRYVGYMYESPDQGEAVYEAKGIETVRRDGCPAVAKMLEKCLRILFETKNVSLVKQYVLRQFQKILTNRISLQDLTFAKEYRGASGYRPGACVPSLELARKWTAVDKRSEPRSSERVPYIIANGPPGVPLIRLVHSPSEFLNEPSLRPNAIYYITKVIIPPINRCFNLIGADLTGWFNQMPRKHFQYLPNFSPVKKNTISQYFASSSCAGCGEQTQSALCEGCFGQPQRTAVVLCEKIRRWEQASYDVNLICQSCTGFLEKNLCVSLDCPVLYRVNQTSRDEQQTTYVRQVLSSLEES